MFNRTQNIIFFGIKMARYYVVANGGNAASGGSLMFEGLGFMFMLGTIVMSLSILSMLTIGCGDCGDKPQTTSKKKRESATAASAAAAGGTVAATAGSAGGGGVVCV